MHSHVILEQGHFSSLAAAKEEELDMLDQAPALSDRSRLGCQVTVTKQWANTQITIPSEFRNMYTFKLISTHTRSPPGHVPSIASFVHMCACVRPDIRSSGVMCASDLCKRSGRM